MSLSDFEVIKRLGKCRINYLTALSWITIPQTS